MRIERRETNCSVATEGNGGGIAKDIVARSINTVKNDNILAVSFRQMQKKPLTDVTHFCVMTLVKFYDCSWHLRESLNPAHLKI